MTNKGGFQGHPQSMRDEATRLARRGVHFRDIAKRLNVSPNTAQKWAWSGLGSHYTLREGKDRQTPWEVWRGNLLVARFVREQTASAYARRLNQIEVRL